MEGPAPRGVYKPLYLVKGQEVLIAIDSTGNVRKHLKIKRPEDEPIVKQALEELLDMIDPRPRLVRDERSEPGYPYDGSAPPPVDRPRFKRSGQRRI